ncbi:winged helix-turn-helix domain-containing protein [Aureispira anguillae]|uniref:Winged helix-turn-helix domain-containing protein n=1 Tax=Aureispira anguillae TaxID=2864201 RepID=A0A915Y9D9_9BACT|nr:winged helix-turn-helix domain-containing protein [Aureispira anguillae]BDS09383.1 winged helix-turn-helix domain-containing protein [Aureispira anguillae]
MTYLELAYKVLEETQRLLWVDDIWEIAQEKGYTKLLKKTYPREEDNINQLDALMYQEVGRHNLRLIETEGLYYLTTFEQLPQLVENALYGTGISSYQDILDYNKPKHFSPSTRGFDGMVLFFVVAIGFPISLYISTTIQGSFYLGPQLLLTTAILTLCFAFMVFLYLQLTNCDISIYPDRIDFYRTFYPSHKILSLPIKNLVSIQANGLGQEDQIKSDLKFLLIEYKEGKKILQKKIRCHGYINPSPIYDPFCVLIRNFESFITLRAFLKEICQQHNLLYREA